MKLINILNDKIQIKTNGSEFKDARLNNLILISDGEVHLVTTITSITDNDNSFDIGSDDFICENESIKVID